MPLSSHYKKISIALLVTAAAIAVYLAVVLAADQAAIRKAIAQITAAQLALILGLSLLNYGLRWWRWQGYIARLGHRIPPGRHVAYYFTGFAFTVTPGKAGEAIRAVYLKPHGVHYMQSLAALFMERLLDLLAVAALASFAIGSFRNYQWLIGLLLALFLLIAWLLGTAAPAAWARRLEASIRIPQLGYLLRHGADMLEASVILRQRGQFAQGLVLGIVAWGAEGVALYFILDWLGADVALSLAVGIYALSMLAGALSFMPGGLGGAELAMGLLLTLSGVGSDIAIAATIVCRLTTLWFAVALGVLAAGIIGARQLHYPHSTS